jgi:Putative MetA-pathway of phenol degradation
MSRASHVVGMTLLLVGASSVATARVVKTKRPVNEAKEVVIGSRIELEDHEFELPLLLEWSPTKKLELSAEIAYARVELDDGRRIGGFKDLEVAAVYELVAARRDRPSFAIELDIKVPTAANSELGTGKPDFTIGGILSREYLHWDAQLAAGYTFVGSPTGERLSNSYELALGGEWHPKPRLDAFAEVVVSNGGSSKGGFGLGGNIPSTDGGFEAELTVGVAERLTPHFKLEQGLTYSSGSTLLFVLGWEYDFGTGD